MKKLIVREMMFQNIIKGTDTKIARKAFETIGFQPIFGWVARRIRWVKITFTAKRTTTLAVCQY